MVKYLLISLFFAFPALADSENFCGRYLEENSTGFLIIPYEDILVGNNFCSNDTYREALTRSGKAKIYLDFTKKQSTLNNWQKFSGHLIEVRAKPHNGYLSNIRFIRDIGK